MTRQALIENIDFRTQRRFPKTYIEGVIDLIWEQFCDVLIKQDDAFYYTKHYEADDTTVELDVLTDRYYVDLPALVVRGGVVSVYAESARNLDLIQITEADFRRMGEQEVYDVSEKIYFYVNFNRIYFDDNFTAILAAAGVAMDLLITFSEFAISDEIPIPKIGNVSLIDAVINYLQGTPIINLQDTNVKK